MRHLTVEVDGVVAVAELLESNAPQTSAAVWGSLPITAVLSHTKWSGSACAFHTDSDALRAVSSFERPVCSIYPGTLAARPDRDELILSYGPSEYRSDLGVEYVTRIARLVDNAEPLLAVLSRMHSQGNKRIIVRRKSDS